MIKLITTTTQTVPPGGAITFDKVVFHSGCGECFMSDIPTSVRLRGGCGSIYAIHMGGNVTNETAALPVQLAIGIGGSIGTAIAGTARSAVPAAAGDLWGIEAYTPLRVCCNDLNRISVINTGTNPVVVAPNYSLSIGRRS